MAAGGVYPENPDAHNRGKWLPVGARQVPRRNVTDLPRMQGGNCCWHSLIVEIGHVVLGGLGLGAWGHPHVRTWPGPGKSIRMIGDQCRAAEPNCFPTSGSLDSLQHFLSLIMPFKKERR